MADMWQPSASPSLPPDWSEVLRLEHGRETLALTSPAHGVVVGPGQSFELELTVRPGDAVRYEMLCEDGLDFAFEARLRAEASSRPVEQEGMLGFEPTERVLEPSSRAVEHKGMLTVGDDGGGSIVLALDNRFSWLTPKTVHATFERRAPAISSGTAVPKQRATHAEEERELRRTHLAALAAEEGQLERKANRLRKQLEAAEAALQQVRRVRAAAEALPPPSTPPLAAADGDVATAVEGGGSGDGGGAASSAGGEGESPPEEEAGLGAGRGSPRPPAERAMRRQLWALWRRLARVDADALVEASWLGEGDVTRAGMQLHRVSMQQRTVSRLGTKGVLTPRSDLERVAEHCMQQIAAASIESSAEAERARGGLSWDDRGQAMPTTPPAAAEPPTPEVTTPPVAAAVPAAADDDASAARRAAAKLAQPGASALEQLQLLSKLLLEIDPEATMEVAPRAGGVYELSAVVVRKKTLHGFGTVTAETNVAYIAEVCDSCTQDQKT